MATRQTAGRLARNAADLLFPPHCILCDSLPDEGATLLRRATLLCADCAERLDNERATPSCPWCAASVAPYEVSHGQCSRCRNRRLRVAGTVRVGPYGVGRADEGVFRPTGKSVPQEGGESVIDVRHGGRTLLGRLALSYKYHGRGELGPVLGGWLAEAVARAPWHERVEAMVSVPTHWTRRLRRPLHAADALASIVAGTTGLVRLPILRRVRAGPHQIGLSYEERVRNVRGAFALRREVRLHDARLLLIDDVKTTGATINECAKILRRGGAAEVYAAVVVTAGWDRTTIVNAEW